MVRLRSSIISKPNRRSGVRFAGRDRRAVDKRAHGVLKVKENNVVDSCELAIKMDSKMPGKVPVGTEE
jgi:hypothetical protein